GLLFASGLLTPPPLDRAAGWNPGEFLNRLGRGISTKSELQGEGPVHSTGTGSTFRASCSFALSLTIGFVLMKRRDGTTAKLCLLAAVSLAMVAAASSGCDRVRTATAAPRETPVPTVTVVRARKMDVPIIRLPNGTTRALNQVTIRARVKGFLQEVHFKEGSNVKKGDLLLVIEEEQFKVKVAQAKAVLEEAEAALKKARESRAKEVAKARVSLDETQLQLDRVQERRERNLVARKAASQEDYDQAKANVD